MQMNLYVFALQGSYGVVKLAYNEDDDKHYVSQRTSFEFQKLSCNQELKSSCSSPLSLQPASIVCTEEL